MQGTRFLYITTFTSRKWQELQRNSPEKPRCHYIGGQADHHAWRPVRKELPPSLVVQGKPHHGRQVEHLNATHYEGQGTEAETHNGTVGVSRSSIVKDAEELREDSHEDKIRRHEPQRVWRMKYHGGERCKHSRNQDDQPQHKGDLGIRSLEANVNTTICGASFHMCTTVYNV